MRLMALKRLINFLIAITIKYIIRNSDISNLISYFYLGINSRAIVYKEGPLGGKKSSFFLIYFNKTNFFLGKFQS